MTFCAFDVLIVGGGQAGASVAIALRQQKFAGTLAIVGGESELPYERPPLSKDYLGGKMPFERLVLRSADYWAERTVELKLGQRVTSVDPSAHTVTLEDGARVGYGRLVWATGGTARRLTCSGHHLRGVHSIRTRADVDQLRTELDATLNVVVIGGGYIGLEAAAILTKLSKKVTVLEAADRVLARVSGEPLSRWLETQHRAHGVDIRLNAKVACIEESADRTRGVRLDDGELVEAEMVIVGIGIAASVEPLLEAGAEGGNGVLVDLHGRTSLRDIYSLGDCAAHQNVYANGAVVRLESVQNAIDQAVIVAKSINGTDERYDAIPWFWSNQYDIRLQTVGLSIDYDDMFVRGSMESNSFSVVYLRAGKVIALDCVNNTKDYVQGKALIASGLVVSRALLADASVLLKTLAVTAN